MGESTLIAEHTALCIAALPAVAPCTLCRIHRRTFYHVYRRTRLCRAAALNSKFLSQRARRSCSRPFARIHPSEKTFARMISLETFLPENFCPEPYARKRELIIFFGYNSIRANVFGQKFSGQSLFGWVDLGEWAGIPPESMFIFNKW